MSLGKREVTKFWDGKVNEKVLINKQQKNVLYNASRSWISHQIKTWGEKICLEGPPFEGGW